MKIRKFALTLSIALTMAMLGSNAYAAVKAGSACTKQGATSIVSGKKYTCIKSGKKIVWDKGTLFKKEMSLGTDSHKPAIKPTSAPEIVKVELNLDSRISHASIYEKVDLCKTTDLTPAGSTNPSSGFPRENAPKSAKIIVLPISFTDYPYNDAAAEKLKVVLDQTVKFYEKTSYGRFKLNFEFVDKSKWIKFDRTAASYNLTNNQPQQNNQIVVEDALKIVDSSINFDNYDGVLMETAYFQIFNGGGQGFPGMKFKTNNGFAKGVSFDFGSGVASIQTIPHELGHSLFYLEDLYVFLNSNRPTVPDPSPAGTWDMMSNSTQEFFGWNKLLMGFLLDSEILCLKTNVEAVQYLHSISDVDGCKLLVINLKEGVSLLAEVRVDSLNKYGLLVYKVDTNISHGDGPYVAEKTLIYSSKEKTIEGWKFSVLGEDSKGLLFKVEKVS